MSMRPLSSALLLSAACCLLLPAGCAPSPGPVRPGGHTPGPATREDPSLPGTEGLEGAEATFTVVADSIPDDPAMEGLVAPFRERLGDEIRQVIGASEVLLAESVPEGTLGNFVTDAMLWAARRASEGPVDMAMTNNGGLRVPIPPGPITIGQMFELMPFENMLSVLTLSGHQVQALADQLAVFRGEPIAGFSFHIEADGESRVARNVLVGGLPLDPAGEYHLVTNDYLANGGGNLTPIHHPLARTDLPILLRDALIEYVREKGVIRAEIEGRITGGIGG